MIRKFIAAVAVSAAALIMTAIPAAAYAPTTEPTETTVTATITILPTEQEEQATTSQNIAVAGESSSIEVKPSSSSIESTAAGSLSYTGVSFNVPLTLTIAALVVLGGFVLVFFGGRGVSRSRRQH